MSRPLPFYKVSRRTWYVQFGTSQHNLGPHPKGLPAPQKGERGWNPPKEIWDLYDAKMHEHGRESDTSLAVGVMDAFLTWAEQNTAVRTFEWYKRHCKVFQNYLRGLDEHPITVGQLKKFHLAECFGKHPKWSATTKNAFCRAVCRSFQWGEDQEVIVKSPMRGFKKPKAKRREIVITEAEYEKAISLFRRQELRELLTVSWETGARPQELFAVERRHVDFDTARCVFPLDESKGKDYPRIIYLTARALEITRRLCLKHPEGPLFRNEDGQGWNRHSISCAFGRIKKKLGKKNLPIQLPAHLGDACPSPRSGSLDGSDIARPCGSQHLGQSLSTSGSCPRVPPQGCVQGYRDRCMIGGQVLD